MANALQSCEQTDAKHARGEGEGKAKEVAFDVAEGHERPRSGREEGAGRQGGRARAVPWPVVQVPPSLLSSHTELAPRRHAPTALSAELLTQGKKAEKQESWDTEEMAEAARVPLPGSLPESCTLI